MINLTLLPDEIVKKVFQYILPIYEYEVYCKNIYEYNQSSANFTNAIQAYNEITNYGTIDLKLNNTTEIALIACIQLEYIDEIKNFVNRNPLFKRPLLNQNLSCNHHRKQFDIHYTTYNISCLEKYVEFRRGVWFAPDEPEEINLINDINTLHKEGSLKDLLFACFVNNINLGQVNTLFDNFMLQYRFINTSIQKVYEADYIRFINMYYSDRAIKTRKITNIPSRKTLIERLMKL